MGERAETGAGSGDNEEGEWNPVRRPSRNVRIQADVYAALAESARARRMATGDAACERTEADRLLRAGLGMPEA